MDFESSLYTTIFKKLDYYTDLQVKAESTDFYKLIPAKIEDARPAVKGGVWCKNGQIGQEAA